MRFHCLNLRGAELPHKVLKQLDFNQQEPVSESSRSFTTLSRIHSCGILFVHPHVSPV